MKTTDQLAAEETGLEARHWIKPNAWGSASTEHPNVLRMGCLGEVVLDNATQVNAIAAAHNATLVAQSADTKRLEVWKQANIVCALSGAVANDCDHHGIRRPSWWRAVKKLQKLVNSDAAMSQEKK